MRALGAVLVAVLVAPPAFMMGRKMFRRRRRETMFDDRREGTEIGREARQTLERALSDDGKIGDVYSPDRPILNEVHAEHDERAEQDERRWASEGIPDAVVTERPIEMTPFNRGVAQVPAPMVSPVRIDCEHCGGRGFVPGINDLLQESAALLGDQGDEVIRLFYSALLRANPQLMTLFPGDPTQGDFGSDHKGAKQRDKLLKALTALADLYDPGNPEKMEHLDQALARYGRAHASYVRQDGTIKGATLEEYAAVKEALFSTLIRVTGDRWNPGYTEAWNQAYDYAAAAMLVEQFRSGFAAPRFPRVAQG